MSDASRRGARAAAPMLPALRAAAERLDALGANLTLCLAGSPDVPLGAHPGRAQVVLRDAAPLHALGDGDHLRLAECYLRGEVDVHGDWLEVMKLTEQLVLDARPLERLRLAARFALRRRARSEREAVAFHYDRDVEFFLPWLDRWRCYSHGLYETPTDPLEDAIERKMQRAIDALGLEPGMQVLDMGGGWGCFVEYAGLRGICVHAVTISETQHRFVERLIRERGLPCTSRLVNFRSFAPERPLDGAVFMGTFEHYLDYDDAASRLARVLGPQGRVWADFCAQRRDFELGGFMKKHLWPGPVRYVDPARLVRALVRAGFNVHELCDDTASYAQTVRDWGDRFDAQAKQLAERFGEAPVRAFRLFLRGSWYYLRQNRTQAYHLVAGREPAPLPAPGRPA